MHEWRDHDLLRRGARHLRARVARGAGGAGRGRALAEARAAARAAGDWGEADRLRAEIEAAGWVVRDVRHGGFQLVPQRVTADLVYGRRAVRELLRGRRQALEIWATERAVASEPWLAESAGPRPRQARARADRAGRHARPPGRRRPRRAVPLRRRLGARRHRVAAARLPRPRQRSAQPGRRLPERRGSGRDGRRRPGARVGACDAGGVPSVGRRRRASAGRRGHEPGPLPQRGEGAVALGLRGGRRRAGVDVGDPVRAGRRLRARRRGPRPAPARPPRVRRAGLDPARGRSTR